MMKVVDLGSLWYHIPLLKGFGILKVVNCESWLKKKKTTES